MSPEQLSIKGTESGHQKALFAWAAMARLHGFELANDMTCYSGAGLAAASGRFHSSPVLELAWLHSIPNGGKRDPVTAALMKAEGQRPGVADVFLPVPRRPFCGFYLEMKKPVGGVQSPEQKQFQSFVETQGYCYKLCRSWIEAADALQKYLSMP